MRPATIVAFERLFLLKIAIGIAAGLYLFSQGKRLLPAGTPENVARFIPSMVAGGVVVGTIIDLVLLWFIARRRSNTARWVLAVLFAIGVLNLVRMQATHDATMPLVSTMAIAVGLLLDAVCLWLIFRRDARAWFRR